ncbi:MAG: hypothetical protein AABX61_03030 [Nanoarchaeota archaeon]
MYDILETDLSFEYLNKISQIKNIVVIGGWAVYLYVNENYRRAFGLDYLKSRDIDVYINLKYLNSFIKEIKRLGFSPSSYFFRHELIYSRNKNKIITEKESKKQQIYDLVYIFLDLFTNKKSKNAWGINIFNKAKIFNIEKINTPDINTLLGLKCVSFFEREKLDKEFKDACDIYALLIYSGKKFKITKNIKSSIDKIIIRRDLSEFIAENVLRDITKVNIVVSSLEKL